MPRQRDDQYTPEEAEQRLRRALQGAFAGPPTPLKDIPTREGKLRRVGGKPQRRRRVAGQRKGKKVAA